MDCVGKVRYFVKAVPKPECGPIAAQYGLDFSGPLRFAMCEAHTVAPVTHEPSTDFLTGGLWKHVEHCLVKSRSCNDQATVELLLKSVLEKSSLFRSNTLVEMGGSGAATHLVAVPLQGSLRGGPWEVRPVVGIKPALTGATLRQISADGGPKNKKALLRGAGGQAFKARVQMNDKHDYYTHPYNSSSTAK